MNTARIIVGDCIESMRELPEGSVNCCVTSPPYYGLRDYGHDGQIGLEESPDAYVQKMVDVFREVRRVLSDDGTVWLNLGDSYAGSWGAQGRDGDMADRSVVSARQIEAHPHRKSGTGSVVGTGYKSKDLMGMPWRVAFALQADGWWLRQDIIWHKPNPMPESVTDRCTKAHEYIFLLSKSARYYYDHEAIAEDSAHPEGPGNQSHKHTTEYLNGNGLHRTKSGLTEIGARDTRNKRSVWTVSTKPFAEAHFATYPPDLIEPCIKAGCPKGGTVLDPFSGSGTTGEVALKLGRNYIGCELNEEYAEMSHRRLETNVGGMFANVTTEFFLGRTFCT